MQPSQCVGFSGSLNYYYSWIIHSFLSQNDYFLTLSSVGMRIQLLSFAILYSIINLWIEHPESFHRSKRITIVEWLDSTASSFFGDVETKIFTIDKSAHPQKLLLQILTVPFCPLRNDIRSRARPNLIIRSDIKLVCWSTCIPCPHFHLFPFPTLPPITNQITLHPTPTPSEELTTPGGGMCDPLLSLGG